MSKHDSGKWGRNGTEAERLRREGWTWQGDGKWRRTAPDGVPETLCGESGQAEMFGMMIEGRGADETAPETPGGEGGGPERRRGLEAGRSDMSECVRGIVVEAVAAARRPEVGDPAAPAWNFAIRDTAVRLLGIVEEGRGDNGACLGAALSGLSIAVRTSGEDFKKLCADAKAGRLLGENDLWNAAMRSTRLKTAHALLWTILSHGAYGSAAEDTVSELVEIMNGSRFQGGGLGATVH